MKRLLLLTLVGVLPGCGGEMYDTISSVAKEKVSELTTLPVDRQEKEISSLRDQVTSWGKQYDLSPEESWQAAVMRSWQIRGLLLRSPSVAAVGWSPFPEEAMRSYELDKVFENRSWELVRGEREIEYFHMERYYPETLAFLKKTFQDLKENKEYFYSRYLKNVQDWGEQWGVDQEESLEILATIEDPIVREELGEVYFRLSFVGKLGGDTDHTRDVIDSAIRLTRSYQCDYPLFRGLKDVTAAMDDQGVYERVSSRLESNIMTAKQRRRMREGTSTVGISKAKPYELR